MALRNPKIFGLDVTKNLADVKDKETALQFLNIPRSALNVIQGSANAGASREDWMSLSRLTDPIYKTLDRSFQESLNYGGLLDSRAGTEKTLFGNLNINGSISGNAIRFRYLDGTGSGATVKIADISTSRVSAWSSVGTGAAVPISYGARVSIRSTGALQFGTQSGISGPRLQTSITPQLKEFDSEFPTHKISCTIGGSSVVLYAMKGIPVVFTGFFRDLDATINLTTLVNNTPASWKIVETGNANNFSKFKNQGNTTSSINYRSSISRERYIQFYYNPDNIQRITLTSANISELPVVKFNAATHINFSSNQLREFPNLNTITPSLKSLNLIANPLHQSSIPTERKLNSAVIDKIPQGLEELYLAQTFYGSITQNIIANRFTGLKVLYLSRGGGQYFHPDNDDPNCKLPNVPDTCQTYQVSNNDFRAFDASSGNAKTINDLTNLVTLDLNGNYYLSGTVNINNDNKKIQSINAGGTNLTLPTGLAGKSSFTTLYQDYARSAGPLVVNGNYLYNGCNSLSTLSLYASNVTGALPKFTNAALSYLELRNTNLTGGDPNGDTSFVIPEKTFENCTNLQYMFLQSGNLLPNKPIHPNAFSYTPNLYYFWYISYGRTTDKIPNLGTNTNLTYLVLHNNNFTGSMPSLASNKNIHYVDVSYNALSGAIPAFSNLSNLYYLYMYNNQFTSLNQFKNLSNLAYFYAHNNKLAGEIPSFEECPNLYYLILFNNQLISYKTGALKNNYNLKYLDLSGNLLTGQAINQILADLLLNYNAANRGGVTVNLRSQGGGGPSGKPALDTIDILRSKGWSIVYN